MWGVLHVINSGIKIFLRLLIILFTTILLLLIFIYGAMRIIALGPSPTAAKLFVLTVRETSAAYWLADLFFTKDAISAFYRSDAVYEEPQMDASLISLPAKSNTPENIEAKETSEPKVTANETEGTESHSVPAVETTAETEKDNNGIEITDVKGPTYYGKLMTVSDPKRVFVGVLDNYGQEYKGDTVFNMIKKYGCIAGTNAGGFYDPNGNGKGAIPDGIVIYGGELLWGDNNTAYSIAGIDGDGLLHVGKMTAAQALESGVKYAASFGPALIINGTACNMHYPLGGGLNPRTAIGQRADGTILLLVINGRQINSLGATLDDLVAIMLDNGAVNATNLDGGSSSVMIYNNEYLTDSAYIFGERTVPTSILVK